MERLVFWLQILISGLLITAVLLQSGRGGFKSSFTNEGPLFSKRGTEKTVFIITLILVFLFLLTAILNTLLSVK